MYKFILFILLFLLVSCNYTCDECGTTQISRPEMKDTMEVFIFGIGRADSILITTENHTVLIDAGEQEHGLLITTELNRRGITSLDYLIITHYDNDHVGGAAQVVNSIDVKNVIVPNYSRDTNTYHQFFSAMANKGITPTVLTETMYFFANGAYFTVDPTNLPYVSFSADDEVDEVFNFDGDNFKPTGDDYSIVVQVKHGSNDFLFAADATTHRRQQLLDNDEFMGINFDFYKVARHGRHDQRTNRFLNHVSPQYAVITGIHPSEADRYRNQRAADQDTLDRLEELNAQIFFTTTQNFTIRSDGRNLSVQ